MKSHNAEESQTIEYKAGLNEWEEGIRSLAAFATARGGKVVFGIHPDGRRQGVQLGKGTLEDFANKESPPRATEYLKGECNFFCQGQACCKWKSRCAPEALCASRYAASCGVFTQDRIN